MHDDILEGGAGADTYVFGSGDGADEIRGDEVDVGIITNNLYFKDATGFGSFSFSRDTDSNLVIQVGSDSVSIFQTSYADSRYSLYYGDSDILLGRLFLATAGGATLTGTIEADLMVGSSSADTLDGGGGDDTLYGGEGDDILDGGGRADTYLFSAHEGMDTISSNNDGTGNKLVFRPLDGMTYTDADFAFSRGNVNVDGTGVRTFSGAQGGDYDDLRITVLAEGQERNIVYIEDYFDLTDDAYTIYRTTFDSTGDGVIVSSTLLEAL